MFVVVLFFIVNVVSVKDVGDEVFGFMVVGVDGEEYIMEMIMKEFDFVVLCFICN